MQPVCLCGVLLLGIHQPQRHRGCTEKSGIATLCAKPSPILVTGAAGRVGAVGRTVTELLLQQHEAVRAMVREEDERARALRGSASELPQ